MPICGTYVPPKNTQIMQSKIFPFYRKMQRFAFLVIISIFALGTQAQNGHGTIPVQTTQDSSTIVQYSIDTLESYPVGPGVVYTRFTITNSGKTRNCYLYDVDLTNPYIRVEETHATTIGKTEGMVTTHHRLDAEGHRSIGSVNCNFWIVNNDENLIGVACTGQVRNGKIGANITNWGLGVAASMGLPEEEQKQELGFLMIDREGKAFIDQYSWDSWVRIDSTSKKLRETNRNRNNPNENEIVLFNSDLGTTATRTVDDLYEVVLDLTGNWVINEEMHGIVRSTNTTGGTIVGEHQAVLQARGTRKAFLQQAGIGDTIHFTIGIYAALTEEYPQIEQLSAGNCLVMKDYRLRFRNWAEQYNNQNYPRTGFGISQDHQRLWMMVMEKPGMFTHEMCSILRYFGASSAMGADGGGSAQFNLGGHILNPTTEANPRAVSNAIFLFSTSPDDEQPASLLFHDGATGTLELPSYASYAPHLRAYNQYGVLIENDYEGFTLSCDPASLGTISADGKIFTASPIGGDGVLVATAGNACVEKAVHIEAGDVRIALDSVICDLQPYAIELYSSSAAGELPVDPGMATWESRDTTIATVDEEGHLRGVRNGRTVVYGTLGVKTDSLGVNVQIADSRWMRQDVDSKDTILNYSSTRGAAVEMPLNLTLYGRPSAVEITILSQPDIKSATVTTSCANTSRHTTTVEAELMTSTMLEPQDFSHSLHLTPEIFSDNPDAGAYPLYIEKFKCMFTGIEKNTDYLFRLVDIICEYASWQEVEALPKVGNDETNMPVKMIVGGQMYILKNNKIYDIHGNEIR